MIVPAVCRCKVYSNDYFSGAHVRSAVVVTAGTPKEKQRLVFPEPLRCRRFAQTNHETKLKEEDAHKPCGREGREKKNNTGHFRKKHLTPREVM